MMSGGFQWLMFVLYYQKVQLQGSIGKKLRLEILMIFSCPQIGDN